MTGWVQLQPIYCLINLMVLAFILLPRLSAISPNLPSFANLSSFRSLPAFTSLSAHACAHEWVCLFVVLCVHLSDTLILGCPIGRLVIYFLFCNRFFFYRNRRRYKRPKRNNSFSSNKSWIWRTSCITLKKISKKWGYRVALIST